jgi:hypothetical protein
MVGNNRITQGMPRQIGLEDFPHQFGLLDCFWVGVMRIDGRP